MGVSYHLYQITTFAHSPKEIALLTRLGAQPSDWSPEYTDHFPSFNELYDTISEMEGHLIEYVEHSNDTSSWQLSVVSAEAPSQYWALLESQTYNGNPALPNNFYFYRGNPETMVEIMSRLAARFGPFILVCDGGGMLLVREDTSPDADWIDTMTDPADEER